MMTSNGLAPEMKPVRIFSNRSPNANVCTSTFAPVLAAHCGAYCWTGPDIWGPVWVATTRFTPWQLTVPIPLGNRSSGLAFLVCASGGEACWAATAPGDTTITRIVTSAIILCIDCDLLL